MEDQSSSPCGTEGYGTGGHGGPRGATGGAGGLPFINAGRGRVEDGFCTKFPFFDQMLSEGFEPPTFAV